jgi:23S rRNA pseudouridine1911/1915/1917 synthase
MLNPYMVDETASYGVVYKPPRMHSVPLSHAGGSPQQTLLDWCARIFPGVLTVKGQHPWEGGILHRLDYETQGLVLFAKTQTALEALKVQQEQGLFIKEYDALSSPYRSLPLPGFPPMPPPMTVPFTIESGFRPFGPGRKAVRPVPLDSSKGTQNRLKPLQLYRTEIMERHNPGEWTGFRIRINRGFRHQIRCHLAWIGFPLLHDGLYGGISKDDLFPQEADFAPLALIARLISFDDPVSGMPRQYRIPGFLESFSLEVSPV